LKNTQPTPEETKTPAAAAAQAEVAKEPTYTFPDASRGVVTHTDKATGTFWIGFKLMAVDFETACLILDAKKLDIKFIYLQIAEAMKQQAAAGSLGDLRARPKQGIAGMMGRLMGRG
jgi:hypothetical protein